MGYVNEMHCLSILKTDETPTVREEVSSGAGNSDAHKQSGRHDLLEVNDYMMSGLVVSSIDKWFMGPVPTFMPTDLGVPQAEPLASSVQRVREMLDKPEGLPWPPVSVDPFVQIRR